jgi:tRNA 2-thiocytidine biosynthesis protein TtcA
VVIRPLAHCDEKDIAEFSDIQDYPIIPCTLCGSQAGLQRQAVKELLNTWNEKYPGRLESMFTAMQNVRPTHLLDTDINNFLDLEKDQFLPELINAEA